MELSKDRISRLEYEALIYLRDCDCQTIDDSAKAAMDWCLSLRKQFSNIEAIGVAIHSHINEGKESIEIDIRLTNLPTVKVSFYQHWNYIHWATT